MSKKNRKKDNSIVCVYGCKDHCGAYLMVRHNGTEEQYNGIVEFFGCRDKERSKECYLNFEKRLTLIGSEQMEAADEADKHKKRAEKTECDDGKKSSLSEASKALDNFTYGEDGSAKKGGEDYKQRERTRKEENILS